MLAMLETCFLVFFSEPGADKWSVDALVLDSWLVLAWRVWLLVKWVCQPKM